MLFNSWQFALFFPIVTGLYFLLPHSTRWALLLVASCIFYMAFIPVYILILFLTIVIDYFAGIFIEKAEGPRRKMYLIVSIISNVGILAFFKYYNFFAWNVGEIARVLDWNYAPALLDIILPIGLSFHTFQAMSYTIEVYRGNQAAERHFGIYALYVMFYPQLVAGPIERPQNLLHQFREVHTFDARRVTDGLVLMTWGMFKKVVIADRLALAVNHVYGDPTVHSGPVLILATVMFAFQIYCDFSGYSEIAIGSAQVMGFRLMRNFHHPYFSTSVPEFWKRWHISLSTWFRDYVYIPLGGNRVGTERLCFNLLITFLLSGLWHGAGWTYIIWGGLNGIYLVFSLLTKPTRDRWAQRLGLDRVPGLLHGWRMLVTFCLICVSWIFFRANNLSDAQYILTHLFDGISLAPAAWSLAGVRALVAELGLTPLHVAVVAAALAVMLAGEILEGARDVRHVVAEWHGSARWLVYYGLLLSMCLFGVFNQSQFIYFQF